LSYPGAAGYVASVNVSQGGVPKMPVGEALVTVSGLFGDSQRNRKIHGGPMRAVCIFSLERITEMRHEGHPIDIGTTGENITVAEIDWDLVRPGVTLAIGVADLEITDYTSPCRTIRESFEGFHFIRMSQKLYPGWSRVYARVLREGMVRTGDPVSLKLGSTS
jgi:MOSC domain-containing protein YiiM